MAPLQGGGLTWTTPDTRFAWNGGRGRTSRTKSSATDLVDLVYAAGDGRTSTSTGRARSSRDSCAASSSRRASSSRPTRVRGSDVSPGDVAPLEVQVDDIVAVMDAAGSDRAVIFGSVDGGCLPTFFAATYPERAVGLVLCDPFSTEAAALGRRRRGGTRTARWEELNDQVRESWGTPFLIESHEDGDAPMSGRPRLVIPWSRCQLARRRCLVAEGRACSAIPTSARSSRPSTCPPSSVFEATRVREDSMVLNPRFIAERDRGLTSHRASERRHRVVPLVRAGSGDHRGGREPHRERSAGAGIVRPGARDRRVHRHRRTRRRQRRRWVMRGGGPSLTNTTRSRRG